MGGGIDPIQTILDYLIFLIYKAPKHVSELMLSTFLALSKVLSLTNSLACKLNPGLTVGFGNLPDVTKHKFVQPFKHMYTLFSINLTVDII